MEQWLARWAHNPKVGGSNPSPATNQVIDKREDTLRRGIEQWLARRAHNPEVAGSNPVPATFLLLPVMSVTRRRSSVGRARDS